MLIRIEFIPHMLQRYPTAGDWTIVEHANDSALIIRVSDTGSARSNLLVAVHELVEAILCIDARVTPAQVDAWDMSEPGSLMEEPGSHPDAPYHRQHMEAEIIERMLASMLGESWFAHEQRIAALFPEEEK